VKARLAALEREWPQLSQAIEELDDGSAPAPASEPARAPRRHHTK
jgi:hypothetical protein